MLEMRIETLVNTVVGQLLVEQPRENEGLYFAFNVGLTYHAPDGRTYDTKRRGLHLFYFARNGYVHVFSGVTSSPLKANEVSWSHECSHDSCWRDVAVISDLYFVMADEINEQLEAGGKPTMAPAAMTQHIYPQRSRSLFTYSKCKVEYDPTDPHHYRRTLTLL